VGHFHILMLYIAGCEGLAVIAVYYFYSLTHPSALLNRFLRYQASLLALCVLNIFHVYIIIDLGAPLIMQELYYLIAMVISAFFLYYMGSFAMGAARQAVPGKISRAYAIFCAILSGAYALPLLSSGNLQTVLVRQKWVDSYIVTLIMGIAIVAYAAFVFIKLRQDSNRNRRIIAFSALLLNGALTGIYILTVIVSPSPGTIDADPYLMATDNFFVFWNLLVLVYFFRLIPASLSKSGNLKAAPQEAATRPANPANQQEWRLVDDALVGKKMFRESGLDLPRLAILTGLPRNRISRLIADATGKTFIEYLNTLRTEEFKRIVTASDFSGNALDAAFESGFNSKTAFYDCIKKNTGLNPGEFIKRARGNGDSRARSSDTES
jgi:AraC-like DNA-binding protein